MVNLRSRSKARAAAPRATPKIEPVIPIPTAESDLSEAALRKLPRAKLQKLAMAHKVKANAKSEVIIQQLLSFQIPKKTRLAEDDPEEGPSRKRMKREAGSEEETILATAENVGVSASTQSNQDGAVDAEPQLPEPEPSAPRPISPAQTTPVVLSYDENLFSGTESEMTEEEQLDFATPISSRSETPPLAHVNNLKRCVKITQEISERDIALLSEVKGVRETAAKLRKRARDVRDLVKAERGRRERMETYFRYWQETEPRWDREWLYGPEAQVKESGSRQPAEGRRATPTPMRKPALSPEELKQKRDAIIAKQEAEQRELEAVWRKELQDWLGSSRESSSEVELDHTDIPSTDEADTNEPLLISYGRPN